MALDQEEQVMHRAEYTDVAFDRNDRPYFSISTVLTTAAYQIDIAIDEIRNQWPAHPGFTDLQLAESVADLIRARDKIRSIAMEPKRGVPYDRRWELSVSIGVPTFGHGEVRDMQLESVYRGNME